MRETTVDEDMCDPYHHEVVAARQRRDKMQRLMTGRAEVAPDEEFEPIRRARKIIGQASRVSSREIGGLAVELGEALWQASRLVETRAERRQRLDVARLVGDSRAQRFTVALTDRACRHAEPARLVASICRLLESRDVVDAFTPIEQLGLHALASYGKWVPSFAAGAVSWAVAREASAYVMRTSSSFEAWLARKREEGLAVNLSYLGEEVVGEEQAQAYAEHCLRLVRKPEVTALSIKASALFSQTNLVAFDETVASLAGRLRPIYLAAQAARPHKLVYLDMESYRDLDLTLTLFMRLLDEPALLGLGAGVVLQAYLPDAVAWQQKLNEWAQRRSARGGGPVRLRLVKGANLNLERVESSLRGWPFPVLPQKGDVDAQFKHMLRVGSTPEALGSVHLGVGSHNLFDIAYALLLRERSELPERVQIEMLYGMAEPLRRTVQHVAGPVLVYLPAVEPQEFASAVAYLVRRFDENAAEENFLRRSFLMESNDADFSHERLRFELSLDRYVERATFRPSVREASVEGANDIGGEPGFKKENRVGGNGFTNEADTDPSRAGDRAFLRACLNARAPVERVPVCIGDADLFEGALEGGFDPSRPGVVPYEFRIATAGEIEDALVQARNASSHWCRISPAERVRLVRAAAAELRRARRELVQALVMDGGKRVEEADSEVSEAVDFAEYYATSYEELAERYETAPRGVVLVTPPWNFPLAIPLGGVFASLLAGNAVVLKPASETPLVAYVGVSALWRAGIPRSVLTFLPCRESLASRLIVDPRVDAVILTGATETARLFRRLRPGIHLLAETGGKNAMIVSALCDRDLAIRDVVRSAFGHAGQKCSALSLLIVERHLYDDPAFRRQLRDAAGSLPVGSAWDPRSFVTPLIRPPEGALARAIALEPGEDWLLEPRASAENPRLLSPGIKWGVQPGSLSYGTELFGPLLSVVPAEDLEHALTLANDTPYGLTAGFHGLDAREQQTFMERMRAGNLYIGRTMTGAIVGRQPFGGHKASSFGPGAKAGGPNYVGQLCRVTARRASVASAEGTMRTSSAQWALGGPALVLWRSFGAHQRARFDERWAEYGAAFEQLASARLLQPELVGEENWLRYQKCRVGVLLGAGADPVDVATLLGVGTLLSNSLEFYTIGPIGEVWWAQRLLLAPGIRQAKSLEELAQGWGQAVPERLRLLGIHEEAAWAAFGDTDAHIEASPVSPFGSVELGRYVVEQSISVCRHRYGNLASGEPAPRPSGLR